MQEETGRENTAAGRGKTRVLVVDDDAVVRELASLCLERARFAVSLAQDGAEAVRRVESGPVDVIVVDLMMPAMDGLRFVQWLRGEAKDETPVVVLTAAADQQLERRVLDAGANRVLYFDLLQNGRFIKPLERQFSFFSIFNR